MQIKSLYQRESARARENTANVPKSLRLSDKAILVHNLVHVKSTVPKSILCGTVERPVKGSVHIRAEMYGM